MEENTKAENMSLDNIIADIISAEEQEDASARVLQVPAVALRGMTVLPGLVIHFDLSRAKSILAVEQAMMSDQRIFLVAQRDIEDDNPDYEEVYHMGCLAQIKQVTRLPENVVRVLVEGIDRARLIGFLEKEERYLIGEVEIVKAPLHLNEEGHIQSREGAAVEEEAMIRNLKELFMEFCSFFPRIGKTMLKHFEGTFSLGILMDELIESMPVTFDKKQEVLEAVDLNTRYQVLARILYEEIEVAKIRTELTEQVKARMEKNQKEYMLREQMNYIREELGEDNVMSDAEQFQQELNKLKAGKEVKEKIQKEINRFKSLGQGSAESSVERGYLETLLDLPWDKMSKDNTDIKRAEKILERDHYGLEQVKERILEFLAVRSLTKQGDSPIICLVGPPGTGKTSIARSVAESLNKKYVRICLGGVRDEAEIRGHRRTYVGAMPGRIVTGLKQAGVKNPLMLLDEIDKVSSDYKGDTSSALLEVLDSEQNNHFRDHYVEIPVDLSEVLFIATANSTAEIPRPLLDRMETIEVTSYTANEKFHIAKEHLIGKQLKKNGLDEKKLTISDGALKEIILSYTSEAGVRELERKIGEICRKAARQLLEQKKANVHVTGRNLEQYLGKRKIARDKVNDKDDVGIVRGLAWTSVGGVTMQVEVNMMPGKGEIRLTGQLGDVMKESAMTGVSYIRSVSSRYRLPENTFTEYDFHIHIPEGAVPKDGPSAGITMATAILSAITKVPVKADVAMTGEITLRGRVLAIGGLKEKLLAAKTAGMKTVLVPRENEKDVEEISREIKNGLDIILVESMEEVIGHAFAGEPDTSGE
nr:endopeptidase La [uncultured Eisenbergiella sp.]